jgi:hypothetical protein
MLLSLKSWIMKTKSLVSRNICLVWMTAFFLLSGVLSYSQQTGPQKARFGFHNGFYFPDQKISLSQAPDDTNMYFLRDHEKGTAINRIYPSSLVWKTSLNDSSIIKYEDPLCRIPEYTESELKTMHEQQDLMWDQYYRMWQQQVKIETYSIDVEGFVRGAKK